MDRPGVYITFDVECGMGGAWGHPGVRPVPPERGVFGRYGDRQYGLPLITDILNRCGLAATFFVEAFNAEQGYPAGTDEACRLLLDHGQDIQLHIHPNHQHYGEGQAGRPYLFTDNMADLPPEEQKTLLAEGCARLERWTGRRPAAFRAGNMGASEESTRLLAAVGLHIDSSYTFPYAGGQCRFPAADLYNGSKWYGDVLELALSGFLEPRWPGFGHAKPLDLMGTSFEECRDAIRAICGAGADAVLILHSFSLFKVRNVQYDGGRLNRIVERRFRRLCRWLADHAAEYPARTFSGLAAALADKNYVARAVSPCRLTGCEAIVRKAVQVFNHPYWT